MSLSLSITTVSLHAAKILISRGRRPLAWNNRGDYEFALEPPEIAEFEKHPQEDTLSPDDLKLEPDGDWP